MTYLIANWKSHKTLAEVKAWFQQVGPVSIDAKQVEVVICPPAVYFFDVVDLIEEQRLPFKVGLQDISPYPFGAYTGAVAAGMVAEWADYAIVGHSERRRYFNETEVEVARKVTMCMEQKITPIVCVDEPYLGSQLKKIDTEYYETMVVAYEPLAAIGTGDPTDPERVGEIARRIKDVTTHRTRVIYGGSVDSLELSGYVELPLVDGVLVGSKSLDAEEWRTMVQVAQK